MKITVKKRGNGYVIYIPSVVRKALGWQKDTVVRFTVTDEGLLLKTAKMDPDGTSWEELEAMKVFLDQMLKKKN